MRPSASRVPNRPPAPCELEEPMPRTHPPLMLPVTPRLPGDSAPGRPPAGDATLASAAHLEPWCQDRSTSARLEATRIPAQSTFRRERSPMPLSRRVLHEALRDDSREALHARSLSPWFHSEGLPACRRFLPARCSPGPRSLERVPAWHQEPSVRLLPPKLFLYPICTRARDARRSTRIRIRPLRGTRRFTPTEPASAGPLE